MKRNPTIMRALLLIGMSILFASRSLYAQVPGYLGKRSILRYELSGVPGFNILGNATTFNANRVLSESERDFFSGPKFINTTHRIAFDRVASRTLSVSVIFDYFQTGARMLNNSGADYTVGNLRAFAPGFGFRFFPFIRRGNIAPVGPYSELNFRFFYLRAVDGGITSSTYKEFLGNFFNFGGSFGFGYNTVLSDMIVINTACALSFTAPLPSSGSENIPWVWERNFTHEFLMLKAGFGFFL